MRCSCGAEFKNIVGQSFHGPPSRLSSACSRNSEIAEKVFLFTLYTATVPLEPRSKGTLASFSRKSWSEAEKRRILESNLHYTNCVRGHCRCYRDTGTRLYKIVAFKSVGLDWPAIPMANVDPGFEVIKLPVVRWLSAIVNASTTPMIYYRVSLVLSNPPQRQIILLRSIIISEGHLHILLSSASSSKGSHNRNCCS